MGAIRLYMCMHLLKRGIYLTLQILPFFMVDILDSPGLPGLFIAVIFCACLRWSDVNLSALQQYFPFFRFICKELSFLEWRFPLTLFRPFTSSSFSTSLNGTSAMTYVCFLKPVLKRFGFSEASKLLCIKLLGKLPPNLTPHIVCVAPYCV